MWTLLLHKPAALAPLFSAILNFALIGWVVIQGAPTRARRMFLLWSLALGLWNVSIAIGYTLENARAALIWYQHEVATVVRFLPLFFLQFIMAITHTDRRPLNRWLVRIGYAMMAVFLAVGWTSDILIKKVHHFSWGYYPMAEPAEMLFGIPFSLSFFYAVYLMSQEIRRSVGYRRNQMKYLLIGACICFGGGFTNFLPLYGIGIYPLGNVLNTAYSLVVAYAIVKYALMDIRIACRQGTVYALVSGALTLVYALLIGMMQKVFSRYAFQDNVMFYSAVVPITVALAPALKTRLDAVVRRWPFWKAPDSATMLGDFTRSVATATDAHAIAVQTLAKATTAVHVNSGILYLSSPAGVWTAAAAQDVDTPAPLEERHPVVQFLRRGGREAIKEKMLWDLRRRPSTETNRAQRDMLAAWPYAAAFPLIDQGTMIGILVLGAPSSGGIFNDDDFHVLRMLLRPAALFFGAPYRRADVAARAPSDEMVMMGVVATEMAHELSRPLTHIMNAGSRLESGLNESTRQNLAKIELEAQRASEILDSFVMLSPKSRLQRETVLLTDLIERAITALGISDDPAIRLERAYASQRPANVHPGQLVQVFTNVLQNACEAMPDGGRLRIHLSDSSAPARPEALIQIEDEGSGISAEALPRVFDLFFTTKTVAGGHGVGLALSRAMVERHGGTLYLESPILAGRGTRAIIRLPLDL